MKTSTLVLIGLFGVALLLSKSAYAEPASAPGTAPAQDSKNPPDKPAPGGAAAPAPSQDSKNASTNAAPSSGSTTAPGAPTASKPAQKDKEAESKK